MPEDLKFQMPKADPSEPLLVSSMCHLDAAGPKEGAVHETGSGADGSDGTLWSFVCPDSDVAEGQQHVFQLFGHSLVLLRHKGELFALEDRCSHMGTSLASGDVEDLADGRAVLRCPGHGICFDLRTGSSNKTYKQRVYPLRKADGKIQVLLDRLNGSEKSRSRRNEAISDFDCTTLSQSVFGLFGLFQGAAMPIVPGFCSWGMKRFPRLGKSSCRQKLPGLVHLMATFTWTH